MKETAAAPWHYDEPLEVVIDAQGHCIGKFEPASGRLAAAAPELAVIAREIIRPLMTHQQLLAAAKSALEKAGL
jgi:hypothetical protein